MSVNNEHEMLEPEQELKNVGLKATAPRMRILELFQKAQEAGLKVIALEDDNVLQDLILSLHHLMCLTFQQTTSVKVFANDMGAVCVNHASPILNK